VQIQRNLQMRIEAQGKKLQKMFEEQLKASRTVMEPTEEEEELQLRDAGGVGASAAFPGVGEQEGEDDAFDDVQLLSVASTGYNDARFPSKIS
jgi:hypothetical protein